MNYSAMQLPTWLTSDVAPPSVPGDAYKITGRPAVIYGLVDPRTDAIRYIGKTEQSLRARVSAHMLEESNCHRVHWLKKLRELGLEPSVVILESIEGAWPWQESERHWIAYGRKNGWPLTNNTDGGDGVCGLPAETRARMAATWRGRKHKPESIEKAKATRKITYPHLSSITKARMSAAHKGRKILWFDKIAAANRKITPEMAEEITSRRAAGETLETLAKEFGVHRTTLSKIKIGTYFVMGQKK